MYETIRPSGPTRLTPVEALIKDNRVKKVLKLFIKSKEFKNWQIIETQKEFLNHCKPKNLKESLDEVFWNLSIEPRLVDLFDILPRHERILICFLSGKWKYIGYEIYKRH
jgi:hypothetical protein